MREVMTKILFIEDDALNRRVVKDMLDVAGFSMEEAPDAEAGLRMLREGAYGLVLMDLRMPGMDGLEATARIREGQAGANDVPIIVVTADTSANIRERCLAGGADDVLMKPVAMKPLFRTIAELMARRPRKTPAAA